MKKNYRHLIFCFLLSGIIFHPTLVHGQTYASKEQFLDAFMSAVKVHNKEGAIGFMDKTYKKNQLKKFLDGDVDQFLNEFFCGTLVSSDIFGCMNFNEITGISLGEIAVEDEGYSVNFIVASREKSIVSIRLLRVTKKGKKTIYGLEGASG